MRRLAFFLLALAGFAAEPLAPSRWRLQYFYDRDNTEFNIVDLGFSSPARGIAVGIVTSNKGRHKPMSIITRDGGVTWTEVPLEEIPVSLFLLNDNTGWMVTNRGLWRTDEAGRTWHRVRKMDHLRRVWFKDETNGWITGDSKTFKHTVDGGKTWTDVPEAQAVKAGAEHTYFDRLEWVSPREGILLGANVAPRPEGRLPSWVDPETLARRREWPGLNITLETKDGGATWTAQTIPTFGRFARIAMGTRSALSLVRFHNSFDYPSEVYLIDRGKSVRAFRQPDRSVTDIAWLGNTAFLAAVEPPGKLFQLPIPGRLHVLRSEDGMHWSEMKVDYRAIGVQAIFAHSGSDLWLATNTGQILKLAR
jgi:photosystem II stability/assembly factor-like uncharacterized protein